MQKIPVKLAEPGMKLAKPVARDNGMVVLAEGLELSEGIINRLVSMNVERIVVQGNPLDLGDGSDSSWGKKSERLDHLFRRYTNDKWMFRVKGFFREYFNLKAAAQKAEAEAYKLAEEQAAASALEADEAEKVDERGEDF
ncbi:hypothetical protein [Maridesulfovibrio ferrireducens]|uniref:hypothetical protein n=1 Tax=Maridesulfovibrio ferrireducens TaxID=246191 RepID=UPI001A3112C9|nr:hypothetical protein [Maridesulfovibrio ferrireducens]MBI9112958.1 hypothetical protein [Maridesulfovibrio ferrireducens]